MDKQFAEIAERLLFDADTVLSSDISQMDNILDTTLDYLVRLQENMTMTDNNGVSPGQTAVESGIAGIESYWRGEVRSFKKSVEDIDRLAEDRFDFVKDQLQLLDSQVRQLRSFLFLIVNFLAWQVFNFYFGGRRPKIFLPRWNCSTCGF